MKSKTAIQLVAGDRIKYFDGEYRESSIVKINKYGNVVVLTLVGNVLVQYKVDARVQLAPNAPLSTMNPQTKTRGYSIRGINLE